MMIIIFGLVQEKLVPARLESEKKIAKIKIKIYVFLLVTVAAL